MKVPQDSRDKLITLLLQWFSHNSNKKQMNNFAVLWSIHGQLRDCKLMSMIASIEEAP